MLTQESCLSTCTREQLIDMALAGLSPSAIHAFSAGAESVGVRKILHRDQCVLEHPTNTSRWLEWEHCMKKGMWAVTYIDAGFPQPLREIPNPPAVLFGQGDPEWMDHFCFAVVGTRQPSTYGEQVVRRFAGELADAGVCVVSGLAFGIDSIAHAMALAHHAPTIAVLGSGLNRIYPVSHVRLADRIAREGVLLSEYPPEVRPRSFHFIQRNRLISGLSRGLLVVEAAKKSGTMITVGDALEQGRDVFCIPGNINQPRSEGTNHLIQQGAALVMDVSDIAAEYDDWPEAPEKAEEGERQLLTSKEQSLYDRIQQGAATVEALASAVPMGVQEIMTTLTLLEMKGLVLRNQYGRWIING